VLQDFPGLRVVPLFLLRSPHEIAMSLFQRVHGDCGYDDALDLTAVHFRRMKGILDEWQGDRAVLQFEPQSYARQAPAAVEMCGLKWDESIFAEVYDPACRHHDPTTVVHEAQSLFEQMGGSEGRVAEQDNLRRLRADTAAREQVFRRRVAAAEQGMAVLQVENGALQQQVAALRRAEADLQEAHAQRIASYQASLSALEAEKLIWDGYRRSRGWAVLQAAWRLRLLLIPRQSWREAVAKMPFRLARALSRRFRSAVSWMRSRRSAMRQTPAQVPACRRSTREDLPACCPPSATAPEYLNRKQSDSRIDIPCRR
jgi:hypothetical protein